MDRLDQLESQSIYIIREAYYHYKKLAVLWSIGKDSTTLVWLCRKAFFGKIPFPALHIDTSYKFPQMYQFRDEYSKKWGMELLVSRNEAALAAGMSCGKKLECCTALKTEGLKLAIAKHGFEALLLGIRRDEHGIRAKERYFSPRDEQFKWDYQDQPPELWDQYKNQVEERTHIRVHPLLHWAEVDIWRYIRRENIPITELYLAKDGQRYRSIGCTTCCNPVVSNAATVDEIIHELETTTTSERAGRAQDKENTYTMQKLRALGYM
ncbi:MAG TPA: sulfate adenylyltransferase subunit CysD [Sedimentisphaerales bacterium]|nr:sulfate adenylyltransferase subunit CysD [Sedimentisphaerales bacterium]